MEEALKDYIEKVATSVVNKLNMNSDDKTYTYEEASIKKNNGIEYNGFTVRESDNELAPTFYVDDYFKNGEDVNKVADIYYELYLESVNNDVLAGNDVIKNIKDFDLIKDNIYAFLCNYNKNSSFEGPNVKIGNLMIRFRVLVKHDEDGIFSIVVTKEIYDKWNTGLTSTEFLNTAYENTKKLFPLEIRRLEDILNDKLSKQGTSLPEIDYNEMYVVTNNAVTTGAIYMLDNNILSDLSNKINSDKIIIIPSSIHEVIVIPYYDPDDDEWDMSYVENMIKEVNAAELSDDEYLSDTPYVYDNNTKQLMYNKDSSIPNNEVLIPFIA